MLVTEATPRAREAPAVSPRLLPPAGWGSASAQLGPRASAVDKPTSSSCPGYYGMLHLNYLVRSDIRVGQEEPTEAIVTTDLLDPSPQSVVSNSTSPRLQCAIAKPAGDADLASSVAVRLRDQRLWSGEASAHRARGEGE